MPIKDENPIRLEWDENINLPFHIKENIDKEILKYSYEFLTYTVNQETLNHIQRGVNAILDTFIVSNPYYSIVEFDNKTLITITIKKKN